MLADLWLSGDMFWNLLTKSSDTHLQQLQIHRILRRFQEFYSNKEDLLCNPDDLKVGDTLACHTYKAILGQCQGHTDSW